MNSILHRIEQANKNKTKSAPESAEKAIADKYIADIKEKAKKEARREFQNELVEAASEAELEGANKKIEGMQSELNTLKELLTNERSQVAQLTDLVKSLKAEIKTELMAKEGRDNAHETARKELSEKIKSLEMALLDEKRRPLPEPKIIQSAPTPPSYFKVTHVRGPDNRIIDSKVEPIYERAN